MSNLYLGTIDPQESNEFYIRLPKYNTSWSFHRREFIKRFPESLITSMLELDKKERVIEIDRPCVNPTAISI